MKTKKVIKFFGGLSATGRALGISRQAVFQWGDIIPERHARRIAQDIDTGGKLKFDRRMYK